MANYHGFVEYEKEFILDKDVTNDICLRLWGSYSSIQLFINGHLIHQSQNWNKDNPHTIGESPFTASIPLQFLKTDSINTIAVKSGTYSGWGGAVLFELGYVNKINRRFKQHIIKDVGVSSISLFIFIYFLFQYLLRKKEKYSLYIALSGLSVSLFIMGFFCHWYSLFNFAFSYWLLTFIGGINMYLLPIHFIHSFFNIKKGMIAKVFTVFYCTLSIFVFLEFSLTNQVFYFVKYIYIFFNLSYILVVPYLFFIGIKAIRQKLEFSKIMFIGILILGISFLLSMLSFASILRFDPPIGEGFFAMIVVFSFVLAKRFAQTHQNLETAHGDLISAANEIRELNDSLEVKVASRTRELSEKNELITESLEYAAQIQQSVLPAREEMVTLFEDYFTLWKPKGIVGGDIYWRHQHEDGFLFAVIDCTGHGVPGALLTMSVTSAMDYIVEQMNIFDPADVLFHLNNIMKGKLNQGSTDPFADDGLEIALVSCTNGMSRLHFAGSKLRLFALEKGEINEYKGSRYSIGFKRSRKDQKFEQHTIHFTEETRFFLTTDGFIEQSGGPKGFGLGWERFRKLLLESRGSMSETGSFLEKSFDDYRNEREQRDDVLVIGFTLDVD
ncbi:SpoIIE family protein phosphatase [Spirochaeta isovalerica]|nr:SpoIIE family protein phosphatase [Spirochaeta isovalerica]